MKTRILILLLVVFASADFAYAASPPSMSQVFYGNAYVNDTLLTQSDSGYIISLLVEGRTLATYTMGEDPTTDNYVLYVPLDNDCSITTAACIGDNASIYINGQPINENPVPITTSAGLTRRDISIGSYIDLGINPADVTIVPGNTDYAIARATPKRAHNLEIENLICKDTNSDGVCESMISNPSTEMSVVFDNTGTLTTTTNSSGEASIKITMDSTATPEARYVYRIRTMDGGWKEAEAIAQANTTAIPEFPSAVLPAMISMITFGLIRKRFA